jgi:hypothetical protein
MVKETLLPNRAVSTTGARSSLPLLVVVAVLLRVPLLLLPPIPIDVLGAPLLRMAMPAAAVAEESAKT